MVRFGLPRLHCRDARGMQREVRAAASPERWAASGVAEHWLMGQIGERSAREWMLGAETVSSEAVGFGIHQL